MKKFYLVFFIISAFALKGHSQLLNSNNSGRGSKMNDPIPRLKVVPNTSDAIINGPYWT